jgi:hypothetical protein
VSVVVKPSSSDIATVQNQLSVVRIQVAARESYSTAKRMNASATLVALAIALAGPILSIPYPGIASYAGALAGGWIFCGRLVIRPLAARAQRRGAAAQSLFDAQVLGVLPAAHVRRTLGSVSPEEVADLAEGLDVSPYLDWYAPRPTAPWPESVLSCLRANAVWARRQHDFYSAVLVVSVALLIVFGIIVAGAERLLLVQYLSGVLLPSLPYLLDASELVVAQRDASHVRREIETQCEASVDVASVHEHLESIQGQLTLLRGCGAMVPEWVYRALRPRFEKAMRSAALTR